MPWKVRREEIRNVARPRFEAGRPAVVFTDLDGTLLDHDTYRPDAVLPAVRALEARGIPIVMATSKTFDEVLCYQRLLSQPRPLIIENGGAICFPEGFAAPATGDERRNGYLIRQFPPGQAFIVAAVERIRAELDARFDSFHERDAAWVAAVTGLDRASAQAARQRRNSLPLRWRDTGAKLRRFREAVARAGLHLQQGGRFLHVQGAGDKAVAMQQVLAEFEARGLADPVVVAFGDSPNDQGMLEAADIAVVVSRPDGSHLALNRRDGIILTRAVGPAGWAEAVEILLGPVKVTGSTEN